MTQEDKELLLKDLCCRLPYGVLLWNSLDARCGKKPFALSKINHKKRNAYVQEEEGGPIVLDEYGGWMMNDKYSLSDFTKPYLRPMSSMTKEELIELATIRYTTINKGTIIGANRFTKHPHSISINLRVMDRFSNCESNYSYSFDFDDENRNAFYTFEIDWLNEHHFDYRGLIEKGLAIAVTEENNPYKK